MRAEKKSRWRADVATPLAPTRAVRREMKAVFRVLREAVRIFLC